MAESMDAEKTNDDLPVSRVQTMTKLINYKAPFEHEAENIDRERYWQSSFDENNLSYSERDFRRYFSSADTTQENSYNAASPPVTTNDCSFNQYCLQNQILTCAPAFFHPSFIPGQTRIRSKSCTALVTRRVKLRRYSRTKRTEFQLFPSAKLRRKMPTHLGFRVTHRNRLRSGPWPMDLLNNAATNDQYDQPDGDGPLEEEHAAREQIDWLPDLLERRPMVHPVERNDAFPLEAMSNIRPNRLFANRGTRLQTFLARPNHDTRRRLQLSNFNVTSNRQQLRRSVAQRLADAGFYTPFANGQATCYACGSPLEYRDADNITFDLYTMHRHACSHMRLQLTDTYVRLYREALQSIGNQPQPVLDFLAINNRRVQWQRILSLNGLPIWHLQSYHFSRVPGRQPYQRGMPTIEQIYRLMSALYEQFRPLLARLREQLSQFSELTIQYVLLVVTQAAHRETNEREIVEFARYLHYRMRQLNRSNMDHLIHDFVRDLQFSDMQEIVEQNSASNYGDLQQLGATPFRMLPAALASNNDEPEFDDDRTDNHDYTAGRDADAFFA